MLLVICFLVGFAFAYASMLAMYNYLRGGAVGQDLKIEDRVLLSMVSAISGMLTLAMFY
jgi:hypothetical protein